jgi:predicted DNA-binding transcriptional regulator AlpA
VELLRRTFAIDLETYERCGGRTKVIALVNNPDGITRSGPTDRQQPPAATSARPGPHVVRNDEMKLSLGLLRAAEFLSMSKHLVYRAVAAGTIPYRKIGAAIRFVPGEINAWADARRAGSP